ncbi:MAG: hypothetical protein QF733_01655 [Phycisphaerales bacterium]|jgi:homoserine dehydrogenase|nr:hypothetical protein [Phycisphaerales bacterium]
MREPIQIVKCGGSILASDPARVADAIATVQGPLIIVVSAPAGETDRRLASIPLNASTSGEQIAEFVSRGERAMADTMASLLQDRGRSARRVTVQDIGLSAAGAALDADPVGLDHDAVHHLLQDCHALVVPGFVATSRSGAWRLLGRGGSDVTAVFLAAELGASCRLIQAAPGIFECDPARGPSGRYARMHWDDLLELDAEVVQAKAVRLAKQRRVQLTVTGLAESPATIVSDSTMMASETSHADS